MDRAIIHTPLVTPIVTPNTNPPNKPQQAQGGNEKSRWKVVAAIFLIVNTILIVGALVYSSIDTSETDLVDEVIEDEVTETEEGDSVDQTADTEADNRPTDETTDEGSTDDVVTDDVETNTSLAMLENLPLANLSLRLDDNQILLAEKQDASDEDGQILECVTVTGKMVDPDEPERTMIALLAPPGLNESEDHTCSGHIDIVSNGIKVDKCNISLRRSPPNGQDDLQDMIIATDDNLLLGGKKVAVVLNDNRVVRCEAFTNIMAMSLLVASEDVKPYQTSILSGQQQLVKLAFRLDDGKLLIGNVDDVVTMSASQSQIMTCFVYVNTPYIQPENKTAMIGLKQPTAVDEVVDRNYTCSGNFGVVLNEEQPPTCSVHVDRVDPVSWSKAEPTTKTIVSINGIKSPEDKGQIATLIIDEDNTVDCQIGVEAKFLQHLQEIVEDEPVENTTVNSETGTTGFELVELGWASVGNEILVGLADKLSLVIQHNEVLSCFTLVGVEVNETTVNTKLVQPTSPQDDNNRPVCSGFIDISSTDQGTTCSLHIEREGVNQTADEMIVSTIAQLDHQGQALTWSATGDETTSCLVNVSEAVATLVKD